MDISFKMKIQGVQTLSEKSNLLILPIQSWSIYDSLGSNWPQDVRNLHIGCKIWRGLLMPPWNHKNGQKWAPIGQKSKFQKSLNSSFEMSLDDLAWQKW